VRRNRPVLSCTGRRGQEGARQGPPSSRATPPREMRTGPGGHQRGRPSQGGGRHFCGMPPRSGEGHQGRRRLGRLWDLPGGLPGASLGASLGRPWGPPRGLDGASPSLRTSDWRAYVKETTDQLRCIQIMGPRSTTTVATTTG